MSKKLHRNGSFRLSDYDYGRNGFYFVTICVKPRENYFGSIIEHEMEYTHFGEIAKTLWERIPKHFPFVLLDEFIVMPDHIHGIIVINKSHELTYPVGVHDSAFVGACHGSVGAHNTAFVGACHGMRLQGNVFSKPKRGSLWTIINHFKGSVTRWANHHNIPFAWQPRYYDRIIRTERELHNVRRYIRNNPKIRRMH